MPTLRGLRRRGYPASAIRAFCNFIGVARRTAATTSSCSSRSCGPNSTARRCGGWPCSGRSKLDDHELADRRAGSRRRDVDVVNNPEDADDGTRSVPFSGELCIEREDFMAEPPPKYFRLIAREARSGCAAPTSSRATEFDVDDDGDVIEVLRHVRPDTRGGTAPDGRKVKSTMHWVSAAHAVDATVRCYERLFAAARPRRATGDPLDDLDPELARAADRAARSSRRSPTAQPGEVVQFERLGYFAADPDVPMSFHRTVGLRDEWANIQKRST